MSSWVQREIVRGMSWGVSYTLSTSLNLIRSGVRNLLKAIDIVSK